MHGITIIIIIIITIIIIIMFLFKVSFLRADLKFLDCVGSVYIQNVCLARISGAMVDQLTQKQRDGTFPT